MLEFAYQKHSESYYSATANLVLNCPELDKNLEVDTCIVGGGYTGLSTLLSLMEQGQEAVLVEGAKIGFGASGRNGGQVIIGYGCPMDVFIKQFGIETAQQFWDMSVESVSKVKQNIADFNIDCDWVDGNATVALKSRQMKDLTERYQQMADTFGFADRHLWQQDQVAKEINSGRYVGGLFENFSGHFHPLNYCLGLAKGLLDKGAQIYENTPITRFEVLPDGRVRLFTPKCSIIAKNVVLGANAYIECLDNALLKPIQNKIMPVETYMIATEPLGEERARSLMPRNMGVCDCNYVLDYYRLSADNRLLFGGGDSVFSLSQKSITERLRKGMLKVFPQLDDVKIDYTWGGLVDVTMNQAPHWGRVAPNIYFAQGFSGHGAALAAVAGKVIAEAIGGNDARLAMFEAIKHYSFPGGKLLRAPGLAAGMMYYQLRDKL